MDDVSARLLKCVSHGVSDTRRFAAEVAAAFGEGAVFALFGDLGAGKTCFVQGLCDALGMDVAVSSPTFAIANEYRDKASGRLFLHLDLYRLGGPDDLDSIGWDDYLASGASMAVEWPQRAAGLLPPDAVKVVFEIGPGPDDRTITATGPAGR